MPNSIWSLKGLFASPRYEIGDIYLTTRVGNPNTLLGYGTWELIPGKTLVCVDTSDSDFNIVKKTGGEKKHTLSINELPSHSHKYYGYKSFNAQFNGSSRTIASAYASDVSGPEEIGGSTVSSGGSQPHNNLQPYFTCYIWIRTA